MYNLFIKQTHIKIEKKTQIFIVEADNNLLLFLFRDEINKPGEP